MNGVSSEMGFSGSGTQTSTLAYGGSPSPVNTEHWNGTAWTEVANLATARSAGGSFGTASAAVYAAGSPLTTATEEFTAADFTINPVTTS
jgi:hypothetical protein